MHVVRITPKRSLSTSPVAKLENSNTLMTLINPICWKSNVDICMYCVAIHTVHTTTMASSPGFTVSTRK